MTPAELAAARKALNLTQRQLAHKLGVYQQSVARWESGKRDIPTYLRLALLGIRHERERDDAPRV